jgi:hypothetical protein
MLLISLDTPDITLVRRFSIAPPASPELACADDFPSAELLEDFPANAEDLPPDAPEPVAAGLCAFV